MMAWFNKGQWVESGCVDCGKLRRHPAPDSLQWGNTFQRIFSDVSIIVYKDSGTRHYLIVLRTTPEKVFLSCAQTFSNLILSSEIEKISRWAKSLEEKQNGST